MSHPERVKDYPKAEVKTLFSSTKGFCCTQILALKVQVFYLKEFGILP